MARTAGLWVLVGLAGFCLLPWYMVQGGFWSFGWVLTPSGSALGEMLMGRWWLAGPGLALLAGLALSAMGGMSPLLRARGFVASGAAGLALIVAQGLLILGRGPRLAMLGEASQPGMGMGAGIVALSLLFILTTGLSAAGRGRGDAFVTGMVGLIVALVGVFVF